MGVYFVWRYSARDYRQVDEGLMVPWKCEVTYFGKPTDPPSFHNKPVLKCAIELKEMKCNNASPADFELKLRAGTRLVKNGEVTRLQEDETELLDFFSNLGAGTITQRARSYWTVARVLFNGTLLCAVAIGMFYWSKKRSRLRNG